ncbi:MAG: alcohol dehydrogenase catalytic domain-containing protein [Limnohabitans sp.]|nr:alcohol dehydrogenase catalytic domain-containing protein [Limnohabitans sp.]
MRALAVVTDGVYETIPEQNKCKISIDNQQIPLAIVEGNKPKFDSDDETLSNSVLVKKTSFSLNYRDLGIIERAWNILKDINEDTYYPIGSDFAGYVEDIGKNVVSFKKGDLVIANCSFSQEIMGVVSGIPSNHASKEFEIFHKTKLIKVPKNISSIEAGALSIGTQTSASMIKKAKIEKGNKVLITSITSNTSFFLLNSLWDLECDVYGLSYTGNQIKTIRYNFPFIKSIFSLKEKTLPKDLLFDVVLDVFSDTYLPKLLPNLSQNARYVTCGVYNQSSKKVIEAPQINLTSFITSLILKNVQLIGNCLGTTEDIENGLKQFERNKMIIDSVFTQNDQLTNFIERTFNYTHDKFGKVVFSYDGV